MKRLISCFLAVSFVMFSINCRKSEGGAAAKNAAKKSAAKKGKSTAPKVTPEQLGEITIHLKKAQEAYKKSYSKGQIRSWIVYKQALDHLKRANKLYTKVSKRLKKQDSKSAAALQKALTGMKVIIDKKKHPQKAGKLTLSLMAQPTIQVSAAEKAAMLGPYLGTIQQIERTVQVEKQKGAYRVGLFVDSPRRIYKWYEVNKVVKNIKIYPNKKTPRMLGVVVRDAKTGAPLANAGISVEFLDAKTKKQLSSQRLYPLWKGYPFYGNNVKLPKSKKTIVQITLSPFPVNRTQRSLNDLRSSVIVHFDATVSGSSLTLTKLKKPLPAFPKNKLGYEVILAHAKVGGQTTSGKFEKLGIAFLHKEKLLKWNNGSPSALSSSGRTNSQIVVFVQDRQTGMLVSDANLTAFLYWKEGKDNYRTKLPLKMVYDGFPSYRANVLLKAKRYNVRIVTSSPQHFRLSNKKEGGYFYILNDLLPPFMSK